MVCLTTLNNDELIQKLSIHIARPEVADIRREILRRIERNRKLTDKEIQLVEDIIAKVKEIDLFDSDLIDQSNYSRLLNRQYFKLKQRLLALMDQESVAVA